MKYITIILILTLGILSPIHAGNPLFEARNKYFKAGKEPCLAGELREASQAENSTSQVLRAYYGASFAIQADCLKGPMKKLKSFNTGKEILDNAIESAPDNPEIRFIRYMVQDGAPSFLDYDNRQEDLPYILALFRGEYKPGHMDESIPQDYIHRMAKAMSGSDFPDEGQRKEINRVLDNKS